MSKKCINCGTDIEDAAMFCPECGAEQVIPSSICPECGVPLPSDAIYCPQCGTKIIVSTSVFTKTNTSGAFSIENLIKQRQQEYSMRQKKVVEEERNKLEEEAKRKAEELAKKEEEERLRQEAEERKKAEAKAKREEAKRKAEELAQKEKEERLRQEAEERKKAEAKAKREEAKRKAEELAQKEKEERLRQEAEEQEKEEAKRQKDLVQNPPLIIEDDGFTYVDLGLSVKWSKYNLGAKGKTLGGVYAWGETQTKDIYNENNYKFGKDEPYFKYQPKVQVLVKKHLFKADEYKTIGDNKNVLELCDDAANASLGDKWRIPTIEEFKELCNECTWTVQTINGKKGYVVRSRKSGYSDNWIFFPAKRSDYLNAFWSSTLADNHHKAHCIVLSNQGKLVIHQLTTYGRDWGLYIRPVME